MLLENGADVTNSGGNGKGGKFLTGYLFLIGTVRNRWFIDSF